MAIALVHWDFINGLVDSKYVIRDRILKRTFSEQKKAAKELKANF